jgi:hypothetical protein
MHTMLKRLPYAPTRTGPRIISVKIPYLGYDLSWAQMGFRRRLPHIDYLEPILDFLRELTYFLPIVRR